jgi:Uncharacterised nucleotidyltransferase
VSLDADRKVNLIKWLTHAISPVGNKDLVLNAFPLSEADWKYVILSAVYRNVAPTLYLALTEHAALPLASVEARDALEGFFELNNLRNIELTGQITEVSAILNRIGVTPIWLKGASVLVENDQAQSSRAMMDLDLWLPERTTHQAALSALSAEGYFVSDEFRDFDKKYPDARHFAPMEKSGWPARLDVHSKVLMEEHRSLLNEAAAAQRAMRLTWNGLTVGVLAREDQLINSLAQCFDDAADNYRKFAKLLDFVERLITLSDVERSQFYDKFGDSEWRRECERLFSLLEHYFEVRSPYPYNSYYADRIKFSIKFPKAYYALRMAERGASSMRAGTLGGPVLAISKLFRHLKNLIDQ